MLREREDYYDKAWIKATNVGLDTTAATMLGESSAYNIARQMLMAALTGNVEVLGEFDQYHAID